MLSPYFGFVRIVFILTCLCWSVALSAEEDPENRVETSSNNILDLPKQASRQSDWLYNAMAVNYVVLNTLDLFTTYKSLEKGAVEVNPIARTFVDRKPMAIAFKAGLTGGVLFALGKMKQQDKKAAYITLGLLNVVYGLVVANNIGVYLQLD